MFFFYILKSLVFTLRFAFEPLFFEWTSQTRIGASWSRLKIFDEFKTGWYLTLKGWMNFADVLKKASLKTMMRYDFDLIAQRRLIFGPSCRHLVQIYSSPSWSEFLWLKLIFSSLLKYFKTCQIKCFNCRENCPLVGSFLCQNTLRDLGFYYAGFISLWVEVSEGSRLPLHRELD
jgi:hypothetical protein